jgi:hypothetical protein
MSFYWQQDPEVRVFDLWTYNPYTVQVQWEMHVNTVADVTNQPHFFWGPDSWE